jgi:hypothetical protein
MRHVLGLPFLVFKKAGFRPHLPFLSPLILGGAKRIEELILHTISKVALSIREQGPLPRPSS